MKKSFSDFFPLPTFLEMRPMGLALTERHVHVVEFIKKGQRLVLGRFATKRIPGGAIKEGYVNDKPAIIEILRSLKEELSMEFVSATLPEEKAYLFKTELPKDAGGNLREAIELRLEENVPLSAADAIFDFAIIPEQEVRDHIDVSVSVLPTKVVTTYLEVMKEAGLKPVSFSIEASALSRAFVFHREIGTFMLVNISEINTTLSIVSRGVVQFSLTIPVGGDAMTNALEKHFSVDNAEARKIKEERGFVRTKGNKELFSSLVNTVSAIKDEINKLFAYWETHHSLSGSAGKKVEKIILCGRDASLVGLDEYLSVAMKIPVEVGNVWKNAFSFDECIPSIPFLDSLDYASAIGLALPQETV